MNALIIISAVFGIIVPMGGACWAIGRFFVGLRSDVQDLVKSHNTLVEKLMEKLA